MSNKSIKEIQIDGLQLLDEVVRLANENGIKYFLIGGTALGAVRHKGFIPWDDDIDIGMKRSEFEKFKRIVASELNFERFYIDFEEVEFPFLKIYLKNTIIKSDDPFSDGNPEFIDIFPFDPISKQNNIHLKIKLFKLIRGVIYSKRLSFSRFVKLYSERKNGHSLFSLVLVYSIKITSYLIPFKFLLYLRNKIMYKPYTAQDVWINWSSPYRIGKEMVNYPDNIGNIIFENRLLPMLEEYQEYLSRMYGDFMTMPPIDERRGHHVKQEQ
ncbi:LicD family protein [Leuconostoc mesenteroides]|uniref:LicD family protein n=1 Tax=Leuconostoc mesenteroides TaxID=1245 RepID=UPI000B8DB817|nr:LicD family protein [Leuconostoc mesenteroides]ASR69474.1 hypothetical protein CBW60_08905 [Leuconostoc mesenteroides]QHM55585.1 hypothetical protein C7M43_00285 [Leuconostoc mesenteroides]